MLQLISENEEFLKRICFSDEAMLHVSGKLNKHNVRICGSEHNIKDIVYRTKVWDITDLKQRISYAIATIDEAMFQRTWQEIEYRFDVLRVTKGTHIKMY